METTLLSTPSLLTIKDRDVRLFNSLMMSFVAWYSPHSNRTAFDMAAFVMEIVVKIRANELGLFKPYKQFSLTFGHRSPHEVALKMTVEAGVYSDVAYFNLQEDDSLRTYLLMLSALKSEGTYKTGIISTLPQKIKLELLVNQTIGLLKEAQKRFLDSAADNYFSENIN